jgi:pilus assembly protein CpaF
VATLIDVTHCETFHRLSHSPGVLVHDHGSTGVRAGIPPYLVAVVTGADTVEAEVRELVRRRGLDPFTDKTAMRRLVDEVVHDYDERTLTSSLPPLPDPRSAARAVYDSVAGFGPLQRHLDDPSVEEIWINERLWWGSSEGGSSGAAVGSTRILEVPRRHHRGRGSRTGSSPRYARTQCRAQRRSR